MSKIIIVDDNEELLESLNFIFEDEGYDVFCFNKPDDFRHNVNKINPDIILMDVILPGTNGDILIKEMQNKGNGLSKTPVFLMSASETAKQKIKDVNIKGFFEKPFNIDDMLLEIKKVLI